MRVGRFCRIPLKVKGGDHRQDAQSDLFETKSLDQGGQPFVRKTLSRNPNETWELIQKPSGWQRCSAK